jgi:hypothetical protein
MNNFEIVPSKEGWTISDASPIRLGELLAEYDRALKSVGVDIDSCLAPGLSEDAIRSGFGEVGLVAPLELVVWFSWHNGLGNAPGQVWAGAPPFMSPASLDWLIERYRYDVEEAVPAGLWTPGWVCLDSAKGVSAFCFDNEGEAPLIRIQDDELTGGDDQGQIVSLCTMVAWWVDALHGGMATPKTVNGEVAWAYDHQRLMEIDKGTMLLV